MGAEHSYQRADTSGRNILERTKSNSQSTNQAIRSRPRQSTISSNFVDSSGRVVTETASPTLSDLSRAPSPPLSVGSDMPYTSYTSRPIGDSPKLRSKPQTSMHGNTTRTAHRKSYPGGAKPKRPQSTSSSHIVVVKPGTSDVDDLDAELIRLANIPQFLPVLRETISSATFIRGDSDALERLQSEHLVNISNRMQTHLNICAIQVAQDQNRLTERTKAVSNLITTLFASFVDMQKTYGSYAEHFSKIRGISQQLSRCNLILRENLTTIDTINNFLDEEDRLEPFLWGTDDRKMRNLTDKRNYDDESESE